MTSPTDTKGPCWKCSRFGGWMPVKVGDRVRYNIISWCLEARQVEATPANGCARWAIQVPARTGPLLCEQVSSGG
jgi:hypothetical protein